MLPFLGYQKNKLPCNRQRRGLVVLFSISCESRNDGRVYSLAVTICESGNKKQYQLEVEYFGYVRDSGKPRRNSEDALLGQLVAMCSYIQKACPGQFVASVERKYEFVVMNGAVAQSDADHKKAHLLKNLEKI